MPLDNAFDCEVQANGGRPDAGSGGPGVSFMPKLGTTPLAAKDREHGFGQPRDGRNRAGQEAPATSNHESARPSRRRVI